MKSSAWPLLLVLVSCSPQLSTQGTVRLWELHPDFTLTDLASHQSGTKVEKVAMGESWLTLIRGKDGPDLVVVEDSYDVQSALKQGLLADLRPYQDRLRSKGKLWQALAPADNKTPLALLPSSVYLWGLFYNPAVLKKLNIAPPTDSASWEAALTTLKAKGVTPLALGASFGWPALAWISMMDLRLNGGEAYRSLVAGTRSFEDPSLLKVFETLKTWREKGWFDPAAATKNWPESLADIHSGQAGFLLLGAYTVNRISDPETLAFLPFPDLGGSDGPAELALVEGFGVSAAAQAPEAAVALADAYVTAGSPGQVGDAYRSPALVTKGGEGFTALQNRIVEKARYLLPTLDKALPPETARKAGLLLHQFFTPKTALTVADLARSLQELRAKDGL